MEAGAQALQTAEEDELPHLAREPAEDGARDEEGHAPEEHGLAADAVGDGAEDGHRGRHRQQVDGEDPGVEVVAREVGDDAGEGSADRRRVE